MNKQHRGFKIAIAIVAVLVIASGLGYVNRGALAAWGFDMFLSKKVEAKLADSYQPLEDRPAPSEAPAVTEPFALLLMGVDARPGELAGRSDTLIYTVVRPQDGNVLMISIPRDAYADIVGKNKKDKITHAYAYGGPEMAVNSVEKLLDAHIDHYASINFEGFVQVVDTLGGIPLPITEDIVNKGADHEKFTIKANQESYSGEEALDYVRYREDAGGDVARTERNRVFLESIIHKASSLNEWDKIPELLGIAGDNFRTDLPPSSLTDLAKQFLQTDHRIQSYTLKGTGARMGKSNLWYMVLDEEDLANVRQTIAAWLNPSTPEPQLTTPGAKAEANGGTNAAYSANATDALAS
ncbi:LCP family protein [Cohnella lubricantis]|uniref:LCP family protein n=1 Tax=Cohnella lubricantis TaxID=2163172 RepID=A0A841TA89_9BACL|nr:LCP family protein [Cohnella lubricantis]MBB6678214.1 LCP family protein [Cohnella lubricantis]MBP2120069.1 LCP family protein required for cell wall assembly [Cohnella lubricantis]